MTFDRVENMKTGSDQVRDEFADRAIVAGDTFACGAFFLIISMDFL